MAMVRKLEIKGAAKSFICYNVGWTLQIIAEVETKGDECLVFIGRKSIVSHADNFKANMRDYSMLFKAKSGTATYMRRSLHTCTNSGTRFHIVTAARRAHESVSCSSRDLPRRLTVWFLQTRNFRPLGSLGL
jgi:hypothetical protein